MADLKLPAVVPGARPTSTPRAEAVRAAQRAFFETALAGEMAGAAPVRAASPAVPVAPVAPAREVRAAIDPSASLPERPLRPGSLLDIKV